MKIRVFQIDVSKPIGCELLFASYEQTVRITGGKIKAEYYQKVFDGEVNADSLESVYAMCNISHPAGYTGRSMSVSDVVEVRDDRSGSSFFFCDSVGFVKIDFTR